MALIFMDGFEQYESTLATYPQRYAKLPNWTTDYGSLSTMTRHGWGNSILSSTNNAVATLLLDQNYQTIIFGIATHLTALPTALNAIMRVGNAATNSTQVGLALNQFGSLALYRLNTGTVLGTSADGVIMTNSWHFVEARIHVHPTAGSVEVRVDGTTVINVSNVNTRGQAADDIRYLNFQRHAGSGIMYYDDLYVFDETGDINNAMIGPAVVRVLWPDGDTDEKFMTPTVAGPNFPMVNVPDPDLASGYVQGLTGREMYHLANSEPEWGTVHAMEAIVLANKIDVGERQIAITVRTPEGVSVGTPERVNDAVLYHTRLLGRNPVTNLPWTLTDLDALKLGVDIT